MIRFQGLPPVQVLETKPESTAPNTISQKTPVSAEPAPSPTASLPPVPAAKSQKTLGRFFSMLAKPFRKLLPARFQPLEAKEEQLIQHLEDLKTAVYSGKARFTKLDSRLGTEFGPDRLMINGTRFLLSRQDHVDLNDWYSYFTLTNSDNNSQIYCDNRMFNSRTSFSSPNEKLTIGPTQKGSVRRAAKRLFRALLNLRRQTVEDNTTAMKLKAAEIDLLLSD